MFKFSDFFWWRHTGIYYISISICDILQYDDTFILIYKTPENVLSHL